MKTVGVEGDFAGDRPRFPLPLTQLVHENLSTIMAFAFSRGPLEQLIKTRFEGEWKHLHKFLFRIAEKRAIKAVIEVAIYLRTLDDVEKISASLSENNRHIFGQVTLSDGSTESLTLREVTNKIIHAADFSWNFSTQDDPVLICLSRKNQQWRQADINIVAFSAFCGLLMS